MGENWGLLKLLLYEVPVSVCSIPVIAQWFPMTHSTLWELLRGQTPPLKMACKTWGPPAGVEVALWRIGFLREDQVGSESHHHSHDLFTFQSVMEEYY